MTGTVKDDDRHVSYRLVTGLGYTADVFCYWRVDIDHVFAVWPDNELVHVKDSFGIEHGTARSNCNNADSAAGTVGGQTRAVDRIDSDVDRSVSAGAEVLAVEKHRSFIFLAFTDDNNAVHVDGVEHVAHRVDSSAISCVFVSAAHQTAGSHSCSFRAAAKLERQIAVR